VFVFAIPLRLGVRLRLGGSDKRHGLAEVDDSPSVGVEGGGVKVLYENVRGKTRGGRPEGCCSIVGISRLQETGQVDKLVDWTSISGQDHHPGTTTAI
jgi:hypothetical protein